MKENKSLWWGLNAFSAVPEEWIETTVLMELRDGLSPCNKELKSTRSRCLVSKCCQNPAPSLKHLNLQGIWKHTIGRGVSGPDLNFDAGSSSLMSLCIVCLQGSETCLCVTVFCSTNLTLSYNLLGCSVARKHFPSAPSAVLELTLLNKTIQRMHQVIPSLVHVLQLMLYIAVHIIEPTTRTGSKREFFTPREITGDGALRWCYSPQWYRT